MNIKSFSIVKYLLNNEYVVIQDSNIVTVKLVTPIIIFKELKCGCYTKVKIVNNSGMMIHNLIYSCSTNMYDITINHRDCMNKATKLNLGSLKNGGVLLLEYRHEKDIKTCSVLSYKMFINNFWNTMYITSNT